MTARLTRNAVRCENCGKVIESTYRHHMVRCACPDNDDAVWVDGGLEYRRMMVGPNAGYTDLSEYAFDAEGGAA